MLTVYTIRQLKKLPADARLGVIGNPIAHSKSPQMQQPALDAEKKKVKYVRLQAGLKTASFHNLLEQLKKHHFIGVNVTVPYKRKAYSIAVKRDKLSELSGSVNTLVLKKDGWHGFNTDGKGFSKAIQEFSGKPLRNLKVLILGACGGAGRALACQCVIEKCPSLTLVNRPKPQLKRLVNKLKAHTSKPLTYLYFDSPELQSAVAQADLIVNATSLGLRKEDPSPISTDWLHAGQMVYDIVTHQTNLSLEAKQKKCISATGETMLLNQGAYAFKQWFRKLPDTNIMRRGLGLE